MGAARETVESWLEGYERAWRSPGTAALRDLFSEDASYRMSPYEDPAEGLERIAALWERERDGPEEGFEMSSEVVAAEGDTGVARVEVRYASGNEYRDLWIVRFGADGRCRAFEEWPFWPGERISPGRKEPE